MNFDRLPKWAQTYIKDLKRQRDTAVKELDKYLDNQKKSYIYTSDFIYCDKKPKTVKKFIQAHRIEIDYGDIECSVLLRDTYGDKAIDINFMGKNGKDALIQPRACNQIYLIAKDRHA